MAPLPLNLQSITWGVNLQRYDGAQIRPLTQAIRRGKLLVTLNGLGYFSLDLSLEKLLELDYKDLPLDAVVEIRRTHGLTKTWSFYKRKTIRTQDNLFVAGFGLNHLLKRRVIAYYAGSSYAQKTDFLDDMMHEIVAENLGASAVLYNDTGTADTARDLTQVMDFSAGTGASAAPSDTMGFSFDNVYETLLKIAANSTQRGTRLFFSIERPGDTYFEFQTFGGSYGLDRRGGKAFGSKHKNMRDTSLTYDNTEEVNYLYVLGRGDRAERKIETVSNETNLNASPLNRMEASYNASNAGDTSLASLGYRQLEKYKPLRLFKGDLISQEGSYYGVDWDLGDLLDIEEGGEEFEAMITGVEFEFKEGNQTSTRGRWALLDEGS